MLTLHVYTNPPSVAAYVKAFEQIRSEITVSQLLLLQRYYQSPGRVSTARRLGASVGFADWRGTNAQYGTLASRLCEILEVRIPEGDAIFLLATFTKDDEIDSGETLLIMRPQVAMALEQLCWVEA